MNILVNATIVELGGSGQVGDSIVRCLCNYRNHHFVIVYPPYLKKTIEDIKGAPNVETYEYVMPKYYSGLITGRNRFMDNIVDQHNIDVVFTIFGPPRWVPKVPHLCGFCRPHILIKDTPYWKNMSWLKREATSLHYWLILSSFKQSSRVFWTENSFLSNELEKKIPNSKTFTVTGYYNQIYDDKSKWDYTLKLPEFDGTTLLTISSNVPHKNLKIIPPAIRYIKKKYPSFKFRVVLTLSAEELEGYSEDICENIIFLGRIQITQCPYLYQQSNIMFLPSLLECFSACYAEAMRMKLPILVPDLSFVKGLCGEAACYYEANSPELLGEAIVALANDNNMKSKLVKLGEEQLKTFDTYSERASRLLEIIENLPEIYRKLS